MNLRLVAGLCFVLAAPGVAQSQTYVDSPFNPGVGYCVCSNNTIVKVHTLAVQDDGKVVVGGDFLQMGSNGFWGDTPRRFIGRVNADGTLDGTFDPGADGVVTTLVLQPDGKDPRWRYIHQNRRRRFRTRAAAGNRPVEL